MRNIILTLVALIDLSANIPYIIDICKGKTKPNIASYSTWVLLNVMAVVAAVVAGSSFNTVALALSYLAGGVAILALSFFKGTRRYGQFDIICQVLAIASIILSYSLKSPTLALALVILTGELAALPTMKHAFLYPTEETFSTYFIAGCAATAFLCLATQLSFAAIALPADAVLGNMLIAAIIFVRRKQKPFLSAKA